MDNHAKRRHQNHPKLYGSQPIFSFSDQQFGYYIKPITN